MCDWRHPDWLAVLVGRLCIQILCTGVCLHRDHHGYMHIVPVDMEVAPGEMSGCTHATIHVWRLYRMYVIQW